MQNSASPIVASSDDQEPTPDPTAPRCRIFKCGTCGRFIGGCTEHRARVDIIHSCAICNRK